MTSYNYDFTKKSLEESWKDFNPTLEDYLKYTFVIQNPANIWTDKTGETVYYLNINLSATLLLAARGGGNNAAMLRAMMKARFIYGLATNPLVMVPLATLGLSHGYMKIMQHYAPHEHHQQPSYWRAIAQAIGAGGVGVGTGADSYV